MLNYIHYLLLSIFLINSDSIDFNTGNLIAKIAGDFPRCDSCKLIVIDSTSKKENTNYLIVEFKVLFKPSNGSKKKSLVNLGASFNTETYKELYSFTNMKKGDTIQFYEIMVEGKNNELLLVLPDLIIKID
jgi:hypothetical protein